MLTLVEQLQLDAANPDIPVVTLLRRAKIAASKLDLGIFERWMEQELSGYTGKLPDYRITAGQVRGWNPYHGWIPVSGNPQVMDIINRVEISDSIGQIEKLIANSNSGFAIVPFSPQKIAALNSLMPIDLPRYEAIIGITVLVAILDQVRNALLDWALNLEKAGVLGGQISFSDQDKAKAQEMSNMTFNIGNIGSLVGNLGSNNRTGDISFKNIDKKQIFHISKMIKRHIEELAAAGADGKALLDATAKIDAVGNKRIDPTVISDIRNALSGAVGSLAASGILYEIAKVFS